MCQCSRLRFNPWSGKIPLAVGHLSPCATTTEFMLRSLCSTREGTAVRSPCLESSPHLLQLEKSLPSNEDPAQPKINSFFKKCMKVKLLSRVQLFVTPWTVAYQAPLSMGPSRQEYWSGLPFPSPYWSGLLFPSPGDLPDPGIEPESPTLQADALTSEPPGKPCKVYTCQHIVNFQLKITSLLKGPNGNP